MDWNDIFKLLVAVLVSIGGAGAIILGLSSWLGKIWANKLMEKDKSKYAKELERLKSDFTQDTEKYKIQLKKSEFFFQEQYKAANEFASFYYQILPEKAHVTMEWEDAMCEVVKKFAKHRDWLAVFVASYSIILDKESIDLLQKCSYEITKYFDAKDEREMHELSTHWDGEYKYGDSFYDIATKANEYIKNLVVQQIKF